MFVALTGIVVSLGIIAVGSLTTALLFPLPGGGRLALVVAGLVAAIAAGLLVMLVRRGMLRVVSDLALRLRVISRTRHEQWAAKLAELDARLRGEVGGEHRVGAALLVLTSQLLHRGLVWATIVASGYLIGAPQLIAVLSAGLVLNWISSLVPMGVGVSEGGNGALFAIIGAPPALGVALALARRVNQIVFAALGFGVLVADRISHHVELPTVPIPPVAAGQRQAITP